MKLQFSQHIFQKKYSNTKFHENPPSGNRAVLCGRADGQAGGETNSCFSEFYERSQKWMEPYIHPTPLMSFLLCTGKITNLLLQQCLGKVCYCCSDNVTAFIARYILLDCNQNLLQSVYLLILLRRNVWQMSKTLQAFYKRLNWSDSTFLLHLTSIWIQRRLTKSRQHLISGGTRRSCSVTMSADTDKKERVTVGVWGAEVG